jgi:hypothetical protein
MLKEGGYKIALWAGPTIRDRKSKIVVVPPRKKISEPVRRYDILCVYISNFFEGKSRKKDISCILNEIKANCKKEAVYCLTTHDFSNKNIDNFTYLIKELADMQKKKEIKIVNLKQITDLDY